MINGYGPTETTTFATCAQVTQFPSPLSTVPIGRPVAGSLAYVLDRQLQPVPAGVPGELFIGGTGVSRGYLGLPAPTAERFLPDPFVGEPGARMYRTGDRVRWRADGEIEFLGRLDQQVKIRGFRVEPGETEQALARHPAVRACAVVAREDRPGDRRLVAYVVGADASLEPEDLRAFLGRALPDYLVPSAIVAMSQLPLTPNGKVDQRALPPPGRSEGVVTPDFVPPRNQVEQVLAGIWGELLRRDRIGVLDNFFALGGHSLLATQVVSRIRRVLAVDLPVRALFETPTVAALAERIATAGHTEAGGQAPPLVRVPRAAYRVDS